MNSCGDPEQDGKKIADLLKYGAHSLVWHSSSSSPLPQYGSIDVKSPVAMSGTLCETRIALSELLFTRELSNKLM